MKTVHVLLAALALPAVVPATSARPSEDEVGGVPGITPAAQPEGPHARAPRDVPLEVLDGDRLRAPGEGWFEDLAEQHPGRFDYQEEAVAITDEDGEPTGDYESGWIDAEGEYVLLYDYDEDEVAYWQNIPAETLTAGRRGFVQYCASCHGLEGDGYGRSAQALRPPPRSFQQSSFKFTKARVGQLPTDDALVGLVKRGLDGTPMYPWALGDEQLRDIVQYIKSLSPEDEGWRDVYAEIEGPADIGDDPFEDDPAAGAELGERVYHRIGCYSCHPGYVTEAEIAEIRGDEPGTRYREDLTYPKLLEDSAYEVQGYQVAIMPPDFTWHTIRAGRDEDGELSAEAIALTVAAGIGGAGMPQWKGSIEDREIWAIGHYVRRLIDEYHGDPAGRARFMASLRADD